jgi:hypothetical protein
MGIVNGIHLLLRPELQVEVIQQMAGIVLIYLSRHIEGVEITRVGHQARKPRYNHSAIQHREGDPADN